MSPLLWHRLVDPLKVGRRHVERPAVVAALGLEAHGWRLQAQARLVEVTECWVLVDRAAREHAFRRAHQSLHRLDAIILQ